MTDHYDKYERETQRLMREQMAKEAMHYPMLPKRPWGSFKIAAQLPIRVWLDAEVAFYERMMQGTKSISYGDVVEMLLRAWRDLDKEKRAYWANMMRQDGFIAKSKLGRPKGSKWGRPSENYDHLRPDKP